MTFDLANSETIPILTFGLGDQHYAIPVADVVEVAAMVALVQVNDNRPEILGMANRHGAVLPILDLRIILGNDAAVVDEWTLFIVTQHQEQKTGFVVDEVFQVEYIPKTQIHKSSTAGPFIRGIISYKQRLIQIIALPPLIEQYIAGVGLDDMLKVDL